MTSEDRLRALLVREPGPDDDDEPETGIVVRLLAYARWLDDLADVAEQTPRNRLSVRRRSRRRAVRDLRALAAALSDPVDVAATLVAGGVGQLVAARDASVLRDAGVVAIQRPT